MARRPPVRRVQSARVRSPGPVSRVIPRSRPEGIRWLRADGTPNWSQRIYEKPGEARLLASRPPRSIVYSSTILEAVEAIAEHRVRGLVVVDSRDSLKGILLTTDIINYLGGGDYYNIVIARHNRSIFKSLRNELVQSIYNPSPIYVYTDQSLEDVLHAMIGEGIGLIPVVYGDGTVYGVLTEHDMVKYLARRSVGRRVRDYMTTPVVTIDAESTIRSAARQMVRYGFRRLPVVSGGDSSVKGMVTAKDLVVFFGSHEALSRSTTGNIEEALETPVYEVMQSGVYTIDADADVGEAASAMIEYGVSSLLVTEEDSIIGIITERDVLVSLVVG